jgi:hypothetical protein
MQDLGWTGNAGLREVGMAAVLDREEYIEQSYFFRIFRERIATNQPAQEVLTQIHEEILSTTRLPYAVQFLSTELKHTGLLSSGFARLGHYFTPFQAFVMRQAEEEGRRFTFETALLVLERLATYAAGPLTPAGLFVYQFETLSRNRLGYDRGLEAMGADPFYDADWRAYLDWLRRQIGVIDFADLIYLRSDLYVADQRRQHPDYEPPLPALFGDKEGRIAKANRGRDPLYLFAALQRQLGYPEVPRPKAPDDIGNKLEALRARVRELEVRVKLVESEVRGQLDLSQFYVKPDQPLPPAAGDDEP